MRGEFVQAEPQRGVLDGSSSAGAISPNFVSCASSASELGAMASISS